MYDLPHIVDYKNKELVLLAMFLQNCIHDKNSDRVKAIEDNKYVEIMDDKMAYEYLCGILRDRITKNYLNKESELMKQIKANASADFIEKVLLAPDMFYAAAMLKVHGTSQL